MSYKLFGNDIFGNPITHIKKFTDDTKTKYFTIPKDEANTDYQEYLEWVSKGNTPEEAD